MPADMLHIEPASGQPDYCCILLHGLGASGEDLSSLAPDLWPDSQVRWLLPDAPMRPITINGGMSMRGWYDVRAMRLLEEEDADGIHASAATINAIINAQVTAGIPRACIVLAGFSQGGAMALYCGTRQPEPLAGIVGMSCYLPLPDEFAEAHSPATQTTPIMLTCGEQDQIINAHDSLASAQLLTAHGYTVDARFYPMEHNIVPQEISDIACFLTSKIAQARARIA